MFPVVLDIDDVVPQFCSGFSRVFRPRYTACDGDEHAFAIPPQAGMQGCHKVASLGANAGSKDPQVRRDGTDTRQRLWLRRTDH